MDTRLAEAGLFIVPLPADVASMMGLHREGFTWKNRDEGKRIHEASPSSGAGMKEDAPMPVERVKNYLSSNGVQFESIVHERTVTAQETAQVTHVKGKELAKSVILDVDGRFLLVAAPASRKVDLGRVQLALDADKVRLPEEAEFSSLFPGCEVGAWPPLGRLFRIEMWADESLQEDEEIAFNAGRHTEIVKMRFADYDRLEAPHYAALVSP